MTEAEFLAQNAKDFETIALETDAILAKATEETWQATRQDNGWTTAQIVEHMCRATMRYEPLVTEALAQADPSDGRVSVGLSLFARVILRGLYSRRVPVPKSLEVTEPIDAEAALLHWDACKELMRSLFESADGKRLTKPRFRNPIVPIFKMSIADFLAVQVEHLRYHAGQIEARVVAGATP